MGVFPDDRSVLVMDNCRIHHTETLQEVLNAQGTFTVLCTSICSVSDLSMTGIMLLYLPPYSPDLNPIEESFSACTWLSSTRKSVY
jgi:transposase